MRRRRDDRAENLRDCWRWSQEKKKFVKAPWQEVHCGDIVLTFADEVFPADLLIIAADTGRAFISTANLDGETNLKERRAPEVCQSLGHLKEEPDGGIAMQALSSMDSSLLSAEAVARDAIEGGFRGDLDEPKMGLDDMGGTALLKGSAGTPGLLYAEHFAPRGCVLRNTAWLVSVAAYLGDETKSRLNVAEMDSKFSNLQVALNLCVKGLICTLLTFCLLAAIMANKNILGDDEDVVEGIKTFIKYFIILYQVVPISLYVCFEIVKLLLGREINRDRLMREPKTGLYAIARTADLVEELGQVDHIFSDKTGTITQNEMRFARCSVEGQDLGEFRPSEESSNAVVNEGEEAALSEGYLKAREVLAEPNCKLYEETKRFFLILAACHSAQVGKDDEGILRYSSSSPDEVAFVDAAAGAGMQLKAQKLTHRDGMAAMELTIGTCDGDIKVLVLCEVPFNSDRKRMSVVCEVDGELICLCKGADSIMAELLEGGDLPDSTKQEIDTYARTGLRTLVLAWKPVEPEWYASWARRLEEAKAGASAEERETKTEECANELEHSFRLSGVSAIEDRLQDGVPQAMATLKAMGIRIWVLTGDKTETAVEIARSCNLLVESMSLVKAVNATSTKQALELLNVAKAKIQMGNKEAYAFVMDGGTMKHCEEEEEGQHLLYDLGVACKVCICCRLAPQQKRKLVEIVRKHDKARITLSIGDGANDVPMIQGAHVGIGVRGKEGNQAVQSSDVAFSQFRFLVPLTLLHGRRAYRRVSMFLCYYIYKHVALALGDLCWAFQSGFSGVLAYPEWLSSAYPGLLTSIPIVFVLTYDRDVPDAVALEHPELYAEGHDRIHFNPKVFAVWVFSGFWHGSLSWFVPSLVMNAGDDRGSEEEGWNRQWWISSLVSMTLVLFCVDSRLYLCALNRLSKVTLLALATSPVAYIFTVLLFGQTAFGHWMQPELKWVPSLAVQNKDAMLALVLTPLALLIDVAVFMVTKRMWPTPLNTVRRTLNDKTSRVSPASSNDQEKKG